MKKIMLVLVTTLVISSILMSITFYITANNEKYDDLEKDNHLKINFSSSQRKYIVISNNSDFSSANGITGGSGSQKNPYLIKNHIIHQDSREISTIHDYYGILIQNTTAHFIIQECIITGYIKKSSYPAGIKLENVSNGIIQDVLMSGNGQAISLENCSNIHLQSNMLQENELGIVIHYSTNITVKKNRLYNHFIHISISDSQQVNIDQNTCMSSQMVGILVLGSTNIFISNNIISKSSCGVEIFPSSISSNENMTIMDISNNTIFYTYIGVKIHSTLQDVNLRDNTFLWCRNAFDGIILTASEEANNTVKNEFDDVIHGNIRFLQVISTIITVGGVSIIIAIQVKQSIEHKRSLGAYMKHEVQEEELIKEHVTLLNGLKELKSAEFDEE